MTKILNSKPFRVLNLVLKYCFEFRYSNFGFSQSGQTLIETVVALFILTTGLAAGLTLAIYSFSSSSVSSNKVIASALAREGLDAVRRLRDSNWLAGTLSDCGGEICYSSWLTAPYNISGSVSGVEYQMVFNPTSTTNKWTLSSAPSGTDMRLYIHPGSGYLHTTNSQPSQFFRKIIIIYRSTSAPYDATSPLVSVQSIVWWWDKNCPQELSDPNNTTCKIVSEENLTNWKNY